MVAVRWQKFAHAAFPEIGVNGPSAVLARCFVRAKTALDTWSSFQ
jgi:hypothetical protein